MADFKAGDLVRLKSGGPHMVVEATEPAPHAPGTQTIKCLWFGPRATGAAGQNVEGCCRDSFPAHGLEVVATPPPPSQSKPETPPDHVAPETPPDHVAPETPPHPSRKAGH